MKSVLLGVCCFLSAAVFMPAQSSTKPMTDQQFVNFAGQTDMVEANLGQLAQTAASTQAVKDYGQMLIQDHTRDYRQLTNAAGTTNLQVPYSIDAEHNQKLIDPLEKLKGAAFDRRYIQEMITGHTKAIEVYKTEAADAKDPQIRSYAEQALPVLEKHLAAAKDLENEKTQAK